jgi:aminomethyltransferase
MKRSPLDDLHRRLGGRFVQFGDWELPLSYESVIAEHKAVRSDAGWFDVSHLGRFELTGTGARAAIRYLLCNDIDRIQPGRTQYTMLLNEEGGIIDDLIVWWIDAERFWVMPNAANQEGVMSAFTEQPGCSTRDLREGTALVAVQGPRAPEILEKTLGVEPARSTVHDVEWGGGTVTLAGTGYTGERGGEVCLNPQAAHELIARLVAEGVTPCGLGARDTLRLEAGLPLWGQDLDETTTPLEAGLGFAVALEHDFVGRAALVAQESRGLDKRLIGLVLEERGVPRHDYPVRAGENAGRITSGNISPMLDRGIALAYVSPPPPPDQVEAEVEIRGKWLRARIAKPPFHRP